MAKNTKHTEDRNIRSAIKRAIITLMKEKNLEKISIGEVVQEAHISRSSFYRYYDSIDDVIKEEENGILDNILTIHRHALSERLIDANIEPYQSTLARAELLREHAEFLAVITDQNGDPQFEKKAKKIMREYFEKKLNYTGTPRENIIIEYMTAGWYYALNYWFTEYPEISAEEFVEYMYDASDVLRNFLGVEKL